MRRLSIVALVVVAASARGDGRVPGKSNGPRPPMLRNQRLERECAEQLSAHDSEFRRCWLLDQPIGATGGHRKPFFDMTVTKDGHVADFVFIVTDKLETRACEAGVLRRFRCTPFDEVDSARLGVLEYPSRCGVKPPDWPRDKQAPPPNDGNGSRAARDTLLDNECTAQVRSGAAEFERCYRLTASPHSGTGWKPFFEMIVGADGRPLLYGFNSGDVGPTRQCLHRVLERFRFTPFTDAKTVALGILSPDIVCNIVDPDRYPFVGTKLEP